MTTMRELLSGFAEPSVSLARTLGRIARSRSVAHGGEVQPEPEMFAEGSVELFQWRREYGGEGRKSTWPVSVSRVRGVIDQSENKETFALGASSVERTNKSPKSTATSVKKKTAPSVRHGESSTRSSTAERAEDQFASAGKKVDTSGLSPEHHAAAKGWKDRDVALEWAAEQQASVREMIAWHNLQVTA